MNAINNVVIEYQPKTTSLKIDSQIYELPEDSLILFTAERLKGFLNGKAAALFQCNNDDRLRELITALSNAVKSENSIVLLMFKGSWLNLECSKTLIRELEQLMNNYFESSVYETEGCFVLGTSPFCLHNIKHKDYNSVYFSADNEGKLVCGAHLKGKQLQVYESTSTSINSSNNNNNLNSLTNVRSEYNYPSYNTNNDYNRRYLNDQQQNSCLKSTGTLTSVVEKRNPIKTFRTPLKLNNAMGNCYLNSVLQLLNCCPKFVDEILGMKDSSKVVNWLKDLFSSNGFGTYSSIKTLEKLLDKDLRGPQDASSFLSLLFSALVRNSTIKTIGFRGVVENKVCDLCGTLPSTQRQGPPSILNVIQSSYGKDLQTAMQKKMTSVNNCPQCGYNTMEVEKKPVGENKYIFIHVNDESTMEFNQRMKIFGEQYSLVGISYLGSCHSKAAVKLNGQWYSCDDSKVEVIDNLYGFKYYQPKIFVLEKDYLF
ncbi:hypothetical protein ABK040_001460 [Willaertia magna]